MRACDKAEEGEEQCREYRETACTTQYVERAPGQHVGDTRCEHIPVNYCTRENCRMVPGPQECHDKVRVALPCPRKIVPFRLVKYAYFFLLFLYRVHIIREPHSAFIVDDVSPGLRVCD